MFLKISQCSQENACVSLFSIKLQAFRPVTLLKRDFNTSVFLWNLQNFWNWFFFLIFCVSKQIRAENEGTHSHRHGPTQWCCGSFWRSQRWGWNNLWKRFLIDILIRKQLNNQYFGRSFSNSGLIFEYKNKLRVGLYRTAQCKLIFHF